MTPRNAIASAALTVAALVAITGDGQVAHPAVVPWPAEPAAVSRPVRPPVSAPVSASVSTPVSTPISASAAADCDPLASLRPQGPLPEPGQLPAGSSMAAIATRGYLIAGVDQDTYRFGFRDPLTRKLEGFDIDIVHAIAEAIFGDPDRVEFRELSTQDQLNQVAEGHVDVVVATITITCARRERMEFSTEYFRAGQRVLVNRGSAVTSLADLHDKPVCAARGSTSLATILNDPAQPVPVGVPGVTDCLVLLQLGKVAAVSTDDALLAGLASQDPQTEIVGPAFTEEPYGVAINLNTPDLVRFVNAVLDRRSKNGQWLASYQRWLTLLGPPPIPPQPRYRD